MLFNNANQELKPEKVRNASSFGSILYHELPSLDQGGLPAGWVLELSNHPGPSDHPLAKEGNFIGIPPLIRINSKKQQTPNT